MTTETVAITHSNEGIRFSWPDSTAQVFSNSVYLAEAYARAIRDKERARKQIVEDVSKEINRLEKILEGHSLQGEVQDLRELLIGVCRDLA